MLPAVLLAVGCATDPCNTRGSFWQRMGRHSRRGCPCECEGGIPGHGGAVISDGPMLGDPGLPPPSPPPTNLGAPMGAPIGAPAVPAPDPRLQPIPNPAQPFPATQSSRPRN